MIGCWLLDRLLEKDAAMFQTWRVHDTRSWSHDRLRQNLMVRLYCPCLSQLQVKFLLSQRVVFVVFPSVGGLRIFMT